MVEYLTIHHKKQKIKNKFSDFLIGSITDTAPLRLPKNKKDITTTQFLRSPNLVKKYGLWGDADLDKKINMFDCFPFDKARHGAASGEEVDTGTINYYNTLDDTRLYQMRSQGLSDQRVALIDSILAARSTGGQVIPDKETLRQFSESRSVSEVQQPKGITIGGSTSSNLQINTPPGYSNDEILNVYTKYQNQIPESERRKMTQFEIAQRITNDPSYKKEINRIIQSIPPEKMQKFAENMGYTNPKQYGIPYPNPTQNQVNPNTGEAQQNLNIQDSTQNKSLFQKALELENKIYQYLGPRTTGNLYIKTRPTLFGGFGSMGGVTVIPSKGTISISELKDIVNEENANSYSQGNLNKKIEDTNQAATDLENKWKDKIITTSEGTQQFEGTEEEYALYQQEYKDYAKKYNDYKDFEEKVQGNQNTLFKLFKQGGKELSATIINLFPESPGQLAMRSAELYGAVRAIGGGLGIAGRLYQGFAPEEQAILSKAVGPGLDIFVGVSGVKEFLNPNLSAGQRVTGLGFGLMGINSLAMKGAKASLEAVTRIDNLEVAKKAAPVISQQFSVDDAIKMGTNADGSTTWKVQGRIITNIKDANTGKVINRIQSDVFSDVVTSNTEAGAVKATVDTYASSIDKYGIKKFVNKPKVTISAQGTKASGEFTFEPSKKTPELILGRGDTEIKDFGTFKGRITKEEINVRLIQKKAKSQARSLSETLSKRLSEGTSTRKLTSRIEVTGREEVYGNLYRTDLTKERLPVRQYYRRIKPTKLINRITETPEYKFVKPYARRYAKQQLEKRSFGKGLQRTFTPDELIRNLEGIKFDELKLKARLPKKAKQVKLTSPFEFLEQKKELPIAPMSKSEITQESDTLNLILKQKPSEKAIAESAAQTQQRAIGEYEKSRIFKPKIRNKSSALGRVWIKENSSLSKLFTAAGVDKTKAKSKEKSLSKSKPRLIDKAISLLGISPESDIIQKVKEEQAVKQITSPLLAEPTILIQPQKLSPPTLPMVFFPREKIPRRPREPAEPKPEPTFFPREKGTANKKETPYDAYAYVQATNKAKARYIKLNKEPLTQESAASLMARYVDENISARGKVVKTPTKIQKGKKTIEIKILAKDTGDRYYEQNRMKFRTWKTRRQIPLPSGVIIERQSYRLDSPGEIKQIKAGGVRKFFGF